MLAAQLDASYNIGRVMEAVDTDSQINDSLTFFLDCLHCTWVCLFLKLTVVPFIVMFSINRIIAMCGDYYIGGRRFSSLSDLIGYYSYVSCLLKGEKLLSPVAPPEVSVPPWPRVYSEI